MASSQARATQRPQRTRTGQMEKAKPIRAPGSGSATGGDEMPGVNELDLSKEVSLKDLEEAAAHEAAHAEDASADAAREANEDVREEAERGDHRATSKAGAALKQGQQSAQAQKQVPQGGKLAHLLQQQKAQSLVRKSASDGFEKQNVKSMALNSTSYSSLSPVGQLQNKLTGSIAREQRPPDAFALLREAREQGVLFKEDFEREGHSEEQEDPELAAAVDECIARCFGVRGILRIGPGQDDKANPIIVVVASQGFSDASLSKVPEKVHRFPTLVAIPFDLLPLRREL